MKVQLKEDSSLLEALSKLSPESSKTAHREWLKMGRVKVDGVTQKAGTLKVKKGQVIALGPRSGPSIEGMRIVYEDNDIVVIDKPSGLLSVSAAFNKDNTAHALLKKYYKPNKVFVVHRLDQDTSGVMLFALSEEAYEKLKQTFEEHDIVREYIAVVEKPMNEAKGTWQHHLYEDGNYNVHISEDPKKGKIAITHFDVLTKNKKCSLVKFTLETGRKNQIRVQSQAAGHSIVGDLKYGASNSPIRRLCLHAQKLAFVHPVTGKKMNFESPLPSEFNKLIKY
jgi:tRNA pseudouridine32 synthase/23S rRNA pseudouridine746 synthase/23S rRNA pseudouridine1911/1915/1917 synthase